MRYTGNWTLRISSTLSATIALALGGLIPIAVVEAQEEVIEEIVVTATKRGETALMDTPVTINVVTGEDLKFREIRNPEDLRTAVSGLYIDEGSSTPRVAIRGVGFDNFQVQAENGVTTYVDGVVVQRTHALLSGFLDLAQIEVLKGPQGSAFGRNATGGAINLITAKPEPGLGGEVSAGYGSFERKGFSGILNSGGDQFGIRLAASYEDSDGFIDNLATGNDDLGAKEQFLGRISMTWDPTDAVSVDYSYSIANYETVAPGQEHTTAISSGTAIFLGTVQGLTPLLTPPAGVIGDDYSVVNSIDPFTDREMDLHALTVEFDLGWASLKSITGYIDFYSLWTSDVGLPSGFEEGIVRVRFAQVFSEQFSQELLLSGEFDRLNWVVGGYYLSEDADNDTEFDLNFPGLPVGTYNVTQNGQDLTSYAFFADGQYELTDRVRFNAGMRWTDDQKEATGTPRFLVFPGGFMVPASPPLDDIEVNDTSVTWQVGLEFDLTDDIFTYFRVAEGYKAGGINNGTATYYDPEELISYELGAKGAFAHGFTFSVAGFYSTYENIQLFVNPPGNPGSSDIINAAEATIAGFDLDMDWRLTDAFSVDVQFTWLAEAEYDDFMAADGVTGLDVDFSGEALNRSPEFTGVFGVNLEQALTERVRLKARAELYVTSEIAYSFLHPVRPDGALTQDGYELFNAYLSATFDENLEVRAYGKNIGDKFYLTGATEGVPGTQYGQHGRPDEYGVELTYRF
ncbi:MAG: TonB-dependent receptor [Candidatus Tectomicrobia bacterium]|nr:TonB-dependent receptor [Candidatus Tectomicrobia bacterium]